MKLHALANHETGFAQHAHIGVRRKQQMQRRHLDLFGKGHQTAHERGAVFIVRCQQARTRHRREGDGRQQLGVVAHAVALEGVGPGVVEYVFATRMGFQIERGGCDQPTIAPQRQIMRRPTRLGRGAARFVQRAQKRVPQKGLVPGQRVPGLGVDAGQVGFNGQAQGIHS
jgi:hypothetical protein